MATGIPYGHVKLACDSPRKRLFLRLGAGEVKLTGGFGGWEITERPRQVAMTTWKGVEPFSLALPLLLDAYPLGDVESQLADLISLARGDDETQPGIVTVAGVPLPNDRWVIEGMDLGDGSIRRGHDGALQRQPVALTLREYVPPQYLAIRKAALQGSRGKTRIVTAGKGKDLLTADGETVGMVARRVGCLWSDLRDLNPGVVRKSAQQLKTGTRLRAPVANTRREHYNRKSQKR